MDRSWMFGKRTTFPYMQGVQEFIQCAEENMSKKGEDFIVCPCCDCQNFKRYRSSDEVKSHLIRRGFKEGYTRWIWHGESLIPSTSVIKETYIDSETHAHGKTKANCQTLEDNEENNASHVSNDENDEDNDRIDEMMRDVQEDFSEMPPEFKNLFDNAEKPLFPGSTKFTKLSGVLKLYNLKAKNGWSDKSFTGLLELIKDMLPGDNELPNSTYEAKKMLCPLGMDIERIHACPTIVFCIEKIIRTCMCVQRVEHHVIKTKMHVRIRKGPPAKVLWYLPIIPRFKRMFANPREAKNLQWHAIGRKEDGKLRHPVDSPQWRNIDRRWPDFGSENRNLRLGLCTDGMNPHGNMSSRHSTWPVLLVVYNLPPWLCMKRKYIMLSLLISGPKQPGNDIDVYLAPLVEDLKILWNEGVPVYDAYTRSRFTLRAMIFCTINDFPAYGNLSGYTTKGAKACPICEDETPSLWLSNCKKNVFMSHRTFLPTGHPYRKKRKAFNGNLETRVARLPLSGDTIYERVKNIEVDFGKTCKTSQTTPWKKSIIRTLLNIQGKTKDSVKVRKDMIEMGIRDKLAPQELGKRTYLPPACHTLSKKEKTSFCACLNGVKVPSGYSSNIKKLVSMKDLKLVGMKSHDCHVLMQHMLPIAIRDILPKHVRRAITKLCFFFNAICSKVIDLDVLDDLHADVVVTLCQFEIWVDNRRCVRIDELGFTLVDFERLGYHDEPFILASHAKQVFYVSDPVDNKWSIVLQSKRSIVGVGDVLDEEEYDHFDETPPFSIGFQSLPLEEDNLEISYMRSDHEEGLWVDNRL
ncbi:PREDICTED: uncharacterized protein LOC109163850 [Ipomoea nil]|uniref:uncharacterized protein LOC109163850 n=1 Tax=Ipomoea nil TaxID=35883 RepID=UPI0009014165|nr:PREDICTED: uncharacterized protein LOC109163850 [Ipomoea nil]